MRRRSLHFISIAFVFVYAVAFFGVKVSAANVCPFTWGRDLREGSVGLDVERLQQFLNLDPHTAIAASGRGSRGHETDTFEIKTARAVSKFQAKYREDIMIPAGLAKPTGEVGVRTRGKLNALCTSAATSDPSTSAGPTPPDVLTVSAENEPASTIIPSGAGGVPLITLTLMAGDKDVTVQSVTVERVGLGADAAFQNIALNDPSGMQIGEELSFDVNHRVVFNQPFVVPAHTAQTYTIAANMAADLTNFAGEMPEVQVDTIAATSPVHAAFPIKSNPQTLNNTIVIGGTTVALSPLNPGTNTNRYINDKNVRFSAIRISANSQEDVSLSSIIWNQSGTAGPNDIQNVVTVVNGSSTPAMAHGYDYISFFSPAIVIPRGQSVDVVVQGDLMPSGAGRTVEFDVFDNTDDIGLSGNVYGFGVGISPSGNTAIAGHSVFITSDGTLGGNTGTPFFSGPVTTINGGSATVIGRYY